MHQLKFVHGPVLADLEIELILIRRLVAAYQRLLFNGAVLLFHFQEPVKLLLVHLSQIVFQFLQLLPVELEIIILQQIDFLGVRQVDLLLLLRLWVYFESHEFLLLVHDHREQPDHFVADALVLLTLDLWNFLLRLYADVHCSVTYLRRCVRLKSLRLLNDVRLVSINRWILSNLTCRWLNTWFLWFLLLRRPWVPLLLVLVHLVVIVVVCRWLVRQTRCWLLRLLLVLMFSLPRASAATGSFGLSLRRLETAVIERLVLLGVHRRVLGVFLSWILLLRARGNRFRLWWERPLWFLERFTFADFVFTSITFALSLYYGWRILGSVCDWWAPTLLHYEVQVPVAVMDRFLKT